MNLVKTTLFLAALIYSFCVQAQDDTLPQANELIKKGEAKAAVELLQAAQVEYADDASFHYLLGLAYSDAGNPEKAIGEFRNALHIKPDLLQAEAELGRNYLLTGNYIAAQFAFDRVKAGNPPPEVLAAMDRYVEQLHAVVQTYRPRFRGSVSLGYGHDSNVNSATSAQRVTLPILGGIVATLSPDGRAQKDYFRTLGIEASGFIPLSEKTELFGNGAINGKINNNVETYDYLSGNIAAGIRHDFGSNQIALSGNYDSISQNNLKVRDSTGVHLEFRRIVHPLAEISAFAEKSSLDYPREHYRDADREVFGFAVNPVAFGKRLFNLPPVASIYWGSERPTTSDVEHLGYRLSGIRLAALAQFNPRLTAFTGLSYEHRSYGAPDPLFAVTRRDDQTDLSAGIVYGFNRSWSLTPVVSYTDNRSSLDVFKYRRTAGALTLRYAF